MKSLNTSLPRSPRRRRSNPPPEQLIQAFKSAALSVTNLYKTAATDQAKSREAGYQDALDDILAFLDKENLGLDDGEGWKVRQWATERLDSSPLAHTASDSDDDRGEMMKRARSSSPQRTIAQESEVRQTSRSTSPIRTPSTPMAPPPLPLQNYNLFQAADAFTFRSAHPYPQDTEMQTPDISPTVTTTIEPQAQIPSPGPSVRLEVVPRGSRTPHRGSRNTTRTPNSVRQLGAGAGTKRSVRFGDYFDLGNFGDGREGMGGGKRGRFT
ncbi:hypothetical protein MMC21_001730 [Puttea exsequens]|nr:hypothetical protein [Puttea exsequens]